MILLGACKTVSGPSRGENCIFPFKASGINHYSCKEGTGKYKKQHWCATKVKFDGSVSTWGWCGDSCPTKAPTTIPNAKGKTFVVECHNRASWVIRGILGKYKILEINLGHNCSRMC